MATRSAIGYLRPNGSIRAVYCHWDGSPSHHLPILKEHYNTLPKVRALIKPGSMSSLWTEQLWDSSYITDPDTGAGHYSPSRQPQPLYHHERGDGIWNDNGAIPYSDPPSVSATLDLAKRHWSSFNCEWLYTFCPEQGWLHYPLP